MASEPRLPLPSGGGDLASRSALGHQPETLAAFNRLYATLWSEGVVDPAVLELARLRNARITDCGI
jgi:alkylhydroperoxidase family enzyme